jgi:hypothetical protein
VTLQTHETLKKFTLLNHWVGYYISQPSDFIFCNYVTFLVISQDLCCSYHCLMENHTKEFEKGVILAPSGVLKGEWQNCKRTFV